MSEQSPLNRPYAPLIWEVSALYKRLQKGDSLGHADYTKLVSFQALDGMIRDSNVQPTDDFFRRQGYKGGCKEFRQAFNKVSLALLCPVFRDLKAAPDKNTEMLLMAKVLDIVIDADVPVARMDQFAKLVGADESAESVASTLSPVAERLAIVELRHHVTKNRIPPIPEESDFAGQENELNELNYVFSKIPEQAFVRITTAMELSGKNYEDPVWTKGLALRTHHVAPDFKIEP